MSNDGVPCSTVLEASWIYSEATEALKTLPATRTTVGKERPSAATQAQPVSRLRHN